MGDELKISVKVQRGREVKKFSVRHYLPSHKSFSRFFEDLRAELNVILEEILKR